MDLVIKSKLYAHCEMYVKQRIQTIELALSEAQKAANSETQSTAGDKHNTARAMMQLAAEQNAKHLNEAKKLKQTLHLIDPSKKYNTIQLGSLVRAESGNFYIAISAGKTELDGQLYFMVSPSSPVAMKMVGLKAGDMFELNGRQFKIQAVC